MPTFIRQSNGEDILPADITELQDALVALGQTGFSDVIANAEDGTYQPPYWVIRELQQACINLGKTGFTTVGPGTTSDAAHINQIQIAIEELTATGLPIDFSEVGSSAYIAAI